VLPQSREAASIGQVVLSRGVSAHRAGVPSTIDDRGWPRPRAAAASAPIRDDRAVDGERCRQVAGTRQMVSDPAPAGRAAA
jgi:hypothetical protein